MAKFKVGDKVKCVVKDWPAAEVISVSKDANGNAIYGVRGQSGMWDEEILTAANAVEGAEVVENFKVGDRVVSALRYVPKAGLPDADVGVIKAKTPGRQWVVYFPGDPKPVYWEPKEMKVYKNESNSISCNAGDATPEEKRLLHELTVTRDEYYDASIKGDKTKAEQLKRKDAELVRKLQAGGGRVMFGGIGKDLILVKNSTACNANFKVGDTVRMKSNALKTVFVIEKITERGTAYLAVKGHESYKGATTLSDLVRAKDCADGFPWANSRACNSEWVLAPKSSASGSYITVKDIGYKDAHKTKKVVVDGNVFWYSPEHAALVKQWVDFQKSKGKSVTTNSIPCNATIDPHVKDVLGDVFGRYKAAVIDYATRARDKYQLEANQLSSKMTSNGDGGEALKAVQAAIKKVFAEVYSTNGIKIQW